MTIIAYAGDVRLEKATWDTDYGMYVKFLVPQTTEDYGTANPFKRFQRMRKGKVGTRFDAVFTSQDGNTFYENEVMLKGWNDGTTGWKVEFWMHGSDGVVEMHPFLQCSKNDQFHVALVELDDDNEAIDQTKRDRVIRAQDRKRSQPKLSNYAAMLCRTPEFWHWLHEEDKIDMNAIGDTKCTPQDAESRAKDWMYTVLGIQSRSELDSDEAKAESFHSKVRLPYADRNGVYYD